jgi:hypothetical protein
MKSGRFILIIITFYLSVVLENCTKSEFIPGLEGNLVGYVYSLDEFSHLLSDHSDVLVTTIGKNGMYRTYSDKNGRFEFENLPAGTYELHFFRSGFGTLKQYGIQHLGGEPTVLNMVFSHSSNGSAFFLYKLPETEITYLNIANDSIYCRCSLLGKNYDLFWIQLYVSLKDDFDSPSADLILTNLPMYEKGDLFSGQLYYDTYLERRPGLPFKPGEKVHFRACASPRYGTTIALFNQRYLFGIDTYFDYENNRTIYPSLGKESSQYSYVMPE